MEPVGWTPLRTRLRRSVFAGASAAVSAAASAEADAVASDANARRDGDGR